MERLNKSFTGDLYHYSFADPSSYFTIENKVLYIHRLNYSSSISVETDITYNNQTIQVSVNTQNEVDMSPYTTRGASFQQHEYPIDVDQYTKPSVGITKH